MLQLVTILSADSNCTNQVPIKISFCFGHRQSGLVAERSVGVTSLQLLKLLVRSLDYHSAYKYNLGNNIKAKLLQYSASRRRGLVSPIYEEKGV